MTTAGRLKRQTHILSHGAYVLVRRWGLFVRGYNYGHSYHSDQDQPTTPTIPDWLERYFDSHNTGPGIWKWRHYFATYDRHLSKFRDREVHIAEVGIYSGGSLAMWKAYFGEQAQVYGVDIEPACKEYETTGIHIFIGDQSDGRFWRRFIQEVPQLDVIIDDGGHEVSQQLPTLEALLPHLRPGGVYICEDSHHELNPYHDYINGLSRNLHAMNGFTEDTFAADASAFQRAIGSIHLYPFLTVIERRGADFKQLTAEKHGSQWQPFLDTPLPE